MLKKMPDKRIGDPRLRGDDKKGGALRGVPAEGVMEDLARSLDCDCFTTIRGSQ